MKLGITDIIKLVSNKQALVETLKREVPGVVDQLMQALALAGGAEEGDTVAVVLFRAETEAGNTTRMARIHRIDPFGELGEELGCIDVDQAVKDLPNEAITKLIPF
jgi:hypothetical protein